MAATGDVTVAAGATLGGSGIVGGDTTIAGLHSPGNSPGVQAFTVVGNLSIAGTNWNDGFGNLLASARPGASFSLSQDGADVVLTYNPVPEPSTLALVACGGALLAAGRRLRRRG